jgi:hypothetical protein
MLTGSDGKQKPDLQQEYIIKEWRIQEIEKAMAKWYLPVAGISLGKILRLNPLKEHDCKGNGKCQN